MASKKQQRASRSRMMGRNRKYQNVSKEAKAYFAQFLRLTKGALSS